MAGVLTVEKMPWCGELHLGVANCLRGNDACYFREAIRSGECEAWRINGGAAYMITRVETEAGKRVLVVCCFEGRDLKEAAIFIRNFGRENGFDHIRFHTEHKGLHRLISEVKPVYVETVFEVPCNG